MTQIVSTGHYIPERIITNADLASRYDVDFDLTEWIINKVGVIERRESDMMPSAQGAVAGAMALDCSDGPVDFILVNTFFGDYTMPQTATLIQGKLGLPNAFAFEVNMPCAGPIYSLCLADMMFSSGRYRRGLLVGVDKIRDLIDPEDYLMNAIFGDGAGALVVSSCKTAGKGIVDFYLGSSVEDVADERYSLKVLAGKAKYPIQRHDLRDNSHYLLMDGRSVKHFIEDKLNEAVDWLLQKYLTDVDQLDYVVTHQANLLIIARCLAKKGIPSHRLLTTAEYLGNTASASVFLTISAHFERFLEKDKNILICGMGGGLTWGAIYYRT